jgi:Mn-dependent DtxR family transcriptional regulator
VNLTTSQRATLLWLDHNANATVQELATHLGVKQSSARDRLVRLHLRGFTRVNDYGWWNSTDKART